VIHVVSKHWYVSQNPAQEFYIGRGSVLGNRATSIQNGSTKAEVICQTPEESITWFSQWLHVQLAEKDPSVCQQLNRIYQAAKQGDVYLICFCKKAPQAKPPQKPCHGDVIKELIESKLRVHAP
jgi:hypothetical protein